MLVAGKDIVSLLIFSNFSGLAGWVLCRSEAAALLQKGMSAKEAARELGPHLSMAVVTDGANGSWLSALGFLYVRPPPSCRPLPSLLLLSCLSCRGSEVGLASAVQPAAGGGETDALAGVPLSRVALSGIGLTVHSILEVVFQHSWFQGIARCCAR